MMTGSTSVNVIYGLENGEAILITITVKETAELKNVSVRTIQRYIKQGKIQSEIKGGQNFIPLSELTETEQLQYYKNHDIELPKELQKPKAKTTAARSTDIESYSAEQREEITFWSNILNEWNNYCIGKPSKTQATKDFAAAAALKYPDIQISANVLYRKKRALKEHGVCGLIDLRGGHNKGSSVIDEITWQAFLYFYLDENQPPVTKCLEHLEIWLNDNHPELLPFPSPSTFYRHIDSDIKESLKVLGREGEKAFTDRCTPYIRREYKGMESNEWWIGDTHTLDIISDNGKILHRLHIVAFLDARSGIFVGWHITDQPSSYATLVALRKAILKYGIPQNIYVDNGREFLTKDVGGLGHRQKKSTKDEFKAPPVIERLGINMTNALVRNAKAKIIERRFRDIKDGLSRLFDTFTGGNIIERPEKLKFVLKGGQGTIPDDNEIIHIVNELIENYFNYEEYNGAVIEDRGKTKLQIYEDNLKVRRVAAEEDLNLMLMRSSRKYKVGRRGVHMMVAGERIDYWNNEFVDNYINKEVYYRYDPDNLSSIRVYDLEDRYLMTVPTDNEAVLEYGASQDEIKAAMGRTRSHSKEVKQKLKEIKNLYGTKTAVEMALEKAHQNKENIQISKSNPVIEIQRADEKLDKAAGSENEHSLRNAISDNDKSLVSIERMIKNSESRINK